MLVFIYISAAIEILWCEVLYFFPGIIACPAKLIIDFYKGFDSFDTLSLVISNHFHVICQKNTFFLPSYTNFRLNIINLPIFKRNLGIFIFSTVVVVTILIYYHIQGIRKNEFKKKKFEESNRELSEISAAKDKLLSIIAHDLKNSFHMIIGLSEITIKRFHRASNEEKFDSLKSINETSVKTYELLMNLLQWTRSHTNTIRYAPQKINLNLLIKENILLVKESANKKKIKISSEINENLFVYIDKNMIDTVVRNLVTNAIKFTNIEGDVKILCNDLEEFIEVCINDNGVGIKPDKLLLLFDAKNLLSTKGTANEVGTGIGLVLSKEFIEINGGKISVESVIGKGSNFKFTLPKFI